MKGTINTQQIYNLLDSGNRDKLLYYNELYAKRANQRLAQLERFDLKSAAADRAYFYLEEGSDFSSGSRFSRSKKQSNEELAANIIQEMKFLNSKTSTKSGILVTTKKTLKTMEQNEVITKSTGGEVKEFTRFLESDLWKDIKKQFYYADILGDASEAIKGGATFDELSGLYERYRDDLSGDYDLLDVWETWTNDTIR